MKLQQIFSSIKDLVILEEMKIFIKIDFIENLFHENEL